MLASDAQEDARIRLRKQDRYEQILLELKLRPHLRISELAERFGVSTETVRRDFEALIEDFEELCRAKSFAVVERATVDSQHRAKIGMQLWPNLLAEIAIYRLRAQAR